MSLTVNLYYTGQNGAAQQFAQAMEEQGIAQRIRQEAGNEKYDYFIPMDDPETVMLIDQWTDQAALDRHHDSPMMQELAQLREQFDLHMRVERFVTVDANPADEEFIRK